MNRYHIKPLSASDNSHNKGRYLIANSHRHAATLYHRATGQRITQQGATQEATHTITGLYRDRVFTLKYERAQHVAQ